MNRRAVKLLLLFTVCLSTLGFTHAQTVRQSAHRVQSPLTLIEMMEKRLGAQFQAHAEEIAHPSSAAIIQNNRVVAHGTIVSASSTQYSYIVFPADVLTSADFQIKTAEGRILKTIPGTPLQLLSKPDNLAIARLTYTQGTISTNRALIRSAVGAFIGFSKTDKSWKTGAITNAERSAYTGVDPGTQRALDMHWKRINLEVNKRRSGFPKVIETDLDLHPTEAGAPIFDRKGNWHGIAISRADQHSTFAIPASRVVTLVNNFEKAH